MERITPAIKITLLGTFDVKVGEESLVFPYDKPKLLWAYLIAEGRPLYRNHIASILWPERSDHHARQNLRQAISTLNRLLNAKFSELFATSRQTIEFIGHKQCWIDVNELKRSSNTTQPSPHAFERWALADLYHGPFCQGLRAPGCDDFEEWLDGRRLEYQSLAINLARESILHYRQAGDDKRVMDIYSYILSIDRHDETLTLEFIEYLLAKGKRPQAISFYRDYERRLEQELGIKPSGDLMALHETLVQG